MPGEPATISVDPEDSATVVLTWPDGSRGCYVWDAGDWRPTEGFDSTPCDVGA